MRCVETLGHFEEEGESRRDPIDVRLVDARQVAGRESPFDPCGLRWLQLNIDRIVDGLDHLVDWLVLSSSNDAEAAWAAVTPSIVDIFSTDDCRGCPQQKNSPNKTVVF